MGRPIGCWTRRWRLQHLLCPVAVNPRDGQAMEVSCAGRTLLLLITMLITLSPSNRVVQAEAIRWAWHESYLQYADAHEPRAAGREYWGNPSTQPCRIRRQHRFGLLCAGRNRLTDSSRTSRNQGLVICDLGSFQATRPGYRTVTPRGCLTPLRASSPLPPAGYPGHVLSHENVAMNARFYLVSTSLGLHVGGR